MIWILFTGLDRCSALSCEYLCHPSPQGGTCYCPDGFIVANDSRSCVGESHVVIFIHVRIPHYCVKRPGSLQQNAFSVFFLFLIMSQHRRAKFTALISQLSGYRSLLFALYA